MADREHTTGTIEAIKDWPSSTKHHKGAHAVTGSVVFALTMLGNQVPVVLDKLYPPPQPVSCIEQVKECERGCDARIDQKVAQAWGKYGECRDDLIAAREMCR